MLNRFNLFCHSEQDGAQNSSFMRACSLIIGTSAGASIGFLLATASLWQDEAVLGDDNGLFYAVSSIKIAALVFSGGVLGYRFGKIGNDAALALKKIDAIEAQEFKQPDLEEALPAHSNYKSVQ